MAWVLPFLFQKIIFIDAGNQCKSGFFQVNLSGGVYEAHGEDFSFEPFRLPVHSAGCVHFEDLDFGSTLNHIQSSFTSTSWAMISQQLRSAPSHHFLDILVFVFDSGVSTRSFLND